MKNVLRIILLVVLFSVMVCMSSCMKEEDYYDKTATDGLILQLNDTITATIDGITAAMGDITAKFDLFKAECKAWITELHSTESHTVTFDLNGGSGDVPSQSIVHGEKVTAPATPTREGYNFLGWYIEDEKWSFYGYTVTADMTLSAKWERIEYTVTIDPYQIFGEESKEFVTVHKVFHGGLVEEPDIQKSVDAYVFDGWTVDGEPWSFSEPITKDITVVGSWSLAKYTVTVDLNGYGENYSVIVEHGSTVQLTTPTASNYEFVEWVDSYGNTWSDDRTVKSDVVITAIWQEINWWSTITYDTTTLTVQMTRCSNYQALFSGCERYLAAESDDREDIDRLINTRNENAMSRTNINRVNYIYYDDIASQYGYTKNINRIKLEVSNKNEYTPDIYCNFMTDMLCTSLLGSFANLCSTTRGGDPDTYGKNYFDFSDPGYMSDFMRSLSISTGKMYVIASDYYIDLIRAMYVVPVNVNLYNKIADFMLEEDYDGNGIKDINDFFCEVMEGKWTYARVAEYAAKAYVPEPGNTSGASINDTLGFVLADNGLSASGILYSNNITLISKHWNEFRGDYDYSYPNKNKDLVDLANALNDLFNSKGVKCVTAADASSVGETTPLHAVRKQFTADKILFGGVILAGSLEYSEYQIMKEGNSGGFGVVPVPIYKYNEALAPDQQYRTQIHVLGRAGGIAESTYKFAQCTAFLHYQSSHSTEILNEYYDYNLTYDTASGLDGNVTMLQYIRANVRDYFDMFIDEAIYYFYDGVDEDGNMYRWHSQLIAVDYKLINMSDIYAFYIPTKQANLQNLIDKYSSSLPD